jgi:hypothetical protein
MWRMGRVGLRVVVRAASATVVVGGLLSAPAAAQFPRSPFSTGAGVVVEAYRFEEAASELIEGIVVGTLPLDARARLGSSLELSVRGQYARGILFPTEGDELELEGFTDTEIRLSATTPGGGLAFSIIGYIPTGQAAHTPEEAAVAGIVAADVLPFRISNWGTGGGLAVHGAASRRFGAVGAGIAASWRRAGEFEPLIGGAVYQPGNELRIRGALDFDLGGASRLSLAGTWYDFTDDQLAGENLYRSGDRIEGFASLAFPLGRRAAAALYGGGIRRENGTFVDPRAPVGPAQDLLLAGFRTRLPLGPVLHVQSFDARFFRPEDGVGEGWMVGTEASFRIPIGPVALTPTVGARTGRLDVRGSGVESRVWGLVAGLGLGGRR